MPRRRKTTAAKNKRRIRTRRPTARNQKKQIASTQNQIIAIKKHLNLGKERMRWHCGFHDVSITGYPLVIPLTSGPSTVNPAVMNTTLGTDVPWNVTMTPAPQNSSALRSKCVVNKQYVDLSISAGNETDLLQFTAFLVQLQPKVAQQTYDNTSSMSSLVRDDDFVTTNTVLGTDSGYGAYLNNSKYKIIKRLEFETAGHPPTGYTGNPGTATGNTGRGTNSWYLKRTQFKVNYGSTLFKSSGLGESQLTLSYPEINPEQKRFIIIFSDNSITDLEDPTVSMSSLITGYAVE